MGTEKNNFENSLKEKLYFVTETHSLSGFISRIIVINGIYHNVIFRGMKNDRWENESSAYRKLA